MANDGAVAGTSSDTSIAGPSRLHIQKPRAKHLTEAAKQRQELTTSFISLLQKEQERDFQPDDEVDSTFAGLANRMRKHFNPDQMEDVLQELNRVVTEAINNVRAGLNPVRMYTPAQPPHLQPVPNIIQGPPQMAIQQQVQQVQQQGPPAMTPALSMQQPVTQIQPPNSFEYTFDDI